MEGWAFMPSVRSTRMDEEFTYLRGEESCVGEDRQVRGIGQSSRRREQRGIRDL